ncbi:interferon-induced protein 44-like [Gambusia affinis]|uniref:interferon-induced protein 44-like n=1 Tax=Gambusia affinis TaxID=33528 RepID=UPI001CDC7639|nr:interferon-induced protein 44-like [Gambusia affinis]
MGNKSSSKAPPPSPLFEEPWRKTTCWGTKQENLKYLKNFQPQHEEVKTIRVLLHGPVGAGKSSFISSVNNILQGRMTDEVLASYTHGEKSFTKKYKTYKIKKGGPGNFYPFVFNDIMGLEDEDGRGVRVEDIKLALKGNMKDDYKFNDRSPLSDGDSGYNFSPSISDKVHVLLCIYSANASEMKSPVLQKMKEVREAASDLGIPQVAILTHIDEACVETKKTLRNIYKSKYLKKKMDDFQSSVGIPLNRIFPLKNYSYETELDSDIDDLILYALRQIIDFGDDFTVNLCLQ